MGTANNNKAIIYAQVSAGISFSDVNIESHENKFSINQSKDIRKCKYTTPASIANNSAFEKNSNMKLFSFFGITVNTATTMANMVKKSDGFIGNLFFDFIQIHSRLTLLTGFA
jgi:hypothetical protein